MQKVTRPWKAVSLAVVILLATTVIGAQQFEPQRDHKMSAERSWEVQAQLKDIEQNRAAFVNRFLGEWAAVLDPIQYDIYQELAPIAMKAPAWQLYGASLVGDFRTMVKVLMGQRGAGKYINELEVAQAKVAPGAYGGVTGAEFGEMVGDTTDSLVFTPITPCRMVDTRGTGARTGLMAAGTQRSFDLTQDGFAKGQGGATAIAQCPGLPNFSHYAWSVNVTVTGYSAFGWLTAWGAGGTEQTSSIINYSSGTSAIANGMTMIGCWNCADDVVIKASSAPTHVIIDVVGYYTEAGISDATVTRVAGTPTTILLNTVGFVTGGACPAGTVLIGGEVDHGSDAVYVEETRQASSTTWTFYVANFDIQDQSVTAYSRCMDQPIQRFQW
jgi:hypothetical protein